MEGLGCSGGEWVLVASAQSQAHSKDRRGVTPPGCSAQWVYTLSCASGTAPDDAGCGDRQVQTKHTAGILKSPCPCSLLCVPMLGHILHLGTGWAMQQGWAGRTKSYHTHQTHLRRHQGWDVNRLVCKCDLLSPLCLLLCLTWGN